MPTNKHAQIRYKILNNCFRNPGRQYTINDLIDECSKALCEIDPTCRGVSRTQIYKDIEFMQSSEGFEIELAKTKDGRTTYYRYKDTSFSIYNVPINETEANQLNVALSLISKLDGLPNEAFINSLFDRLNFRSIEKKNDNVISFSSNPYLKGLDFLVELYNAIVYKKVLLIHYKPFHKETAEIIELHPYFLKQYNNRWFVFGLFPILDKPDWNLAVDRIDKIELSRAEYTENETINWLEYFDDFIGVTKPTDTPLQKITLHFFNKTAKYIETKPIHSSQRARWINNDTLEINLELMINFELEQLLLSYADSMVVLSPKSIRDSITNRLIKAFELNSSYIEGDKQ